MEHTDFDLHSPSDAPLPRPTREGGLGRVIVALLVGVALLGGGYALYLNRRAAAPAGSNAAGTAAVPAPPTALGADAATVEVHALDQSDAFVRELVSTLSTDPRFITWLATDRLIRTFVVVVDNIASGATPAQHVRMMRPLSPFRVSGTGSAVSVDPRSYERYTALADAAASIDAAGSARVYTTLKPRIEEAYRELGYPDTPFDRTLERAIVVLLSTPVSDAAPRLRAAGASGYAYADPRLESLSAAQRQLLRFGPRNARVIQAALRTMALALGIPPDRLPPAGA